MQGNLASVSNHGPFLPLATEATQDPMTSILQSYPWIHGFLLLLFILYLKFFIYL